MSRSINTTLTKELFSGIHLVAITEAIPHEEGIKIKFSDGTNKSFEKIYDYTSSEFLKMCYSAGTITDNSLFSANDLGKRLWICIKECWTITNDSEIVNFELFDTLLYNEGASVPPKVKGNPQDNKGVASGEFYESKASFAEMRTEFIDNSFDLPLPKPNNSQLAPDKKKMILEAKEMIKKVESGIKEVKPKTVVDEFDEM